MKQPGVTLDTIGGGVLPELFQAELQRILSNITDPNTDATKKRSITVTLDFSPTKDRDVADVDIRGPQRRTLAGLDWIIAGGESGPHARPSHPLWFRQVRDACQRAGVAFHFKQWGEYVPLAPIYGRDVHYGDLDAAAVNAVDARCEILTPHSVWIDGDGQPPPGSWMVERVGKKAAGRALDGREWQEFPAVLA